MFKLLCFNTGFVLDVNAYLAVKYILLYQIALLNV